MSISIFLDQIVNHQFLIKTKISSGAFGVVYQAEDIINNEHVTLFTKGGGQGRKRRTI